MEARTIYTTENGEEFLFSVDGNELKLSILDSDGYEVGNLTFLGKKEVNLFKILLQQSIDLLPKDKEKDGTTSLGYSVI